jgi:hypothetical protein
MPGRGPAPKPAAQRLRANVPALGEWTSAPGVGWQHGAMPAPPKGLTEESVAVWTAWMRSWFAAYWLPEDLPGLWHAIGTYDMAVRFRLMPKVETRDPDGTVTIVSRPNPGAEVRQMMDTYGITPKGQQDRRWKRPDTTPVGKADPVDFDPRKAYAGLRDVPPPKGAPN